MSTRLVITLRCSEYSSFYFPGFFHYSKTSYIFIPNPIQSSHSNHSIQSHLIHSLYFPRFFRSLARLTKYSNLPTLLIPFAFKSYIIIASISFYPIFKAELEKIRYSRTYFHDIFLQHRAVQRAPTLHALVFIFVIKNCIKFLLCSSPPPCRFRFFVGTHSRRKVFTENPTITFILLYDSRSCLAFCACVAPQANVHGDR